MHYFEQDRPQTPNRKPQPPNPKSKKEIGKKETREKEMGVRGTEGEKEVHPSLEFRVQLTLSPSGCSAGGWAGGDGSW